MKLSDSMKIQLVSGVCLISLVVILKNLIMVPATTLATDVIVYIAIYGGFVLLKPKDVNHSAALLVLITAAIISFYMMF
jgi:hypothetical protein